MRIDVIPVFGKMISSHISGSTVIVVDVLRSTSCITMAVENGAERVIPAVDPGEAASIASRLGLRDCVLAGERGGIKLPGFNLGNSPAEYSRKNVQDKTVVISTSNGTAAIHGSSAAKEVLIGAMINRTAVAKKAIALGNDILIVCAGTDGAISADDLIAAGSIADAVSRLAPGDVSATDIAKVCCMLYADWREGRADLAHTTHYARLVRLGFGEDVRFCFTEDLSDTVPVYKDGIIR